MSTPAAGFRPVKAAGNFLRRRRAADLAVTRGLPAGPALTEAMPAAGRQPGRHRSTRPAADEVSLTDALRELKDEDAPAEPVFTAVPRAVNRDTAEIPELREEAPADVLSPAATVPVTAAPVIGDKLPGPAEPAPPAAIPAPGSSPVLYAGDGWAARLMRMRVNAGEWDDVHAIAERGLGRNAADTAAALRHSRTSIAEGVRQWCAAIGRPDLADALLRRTAEFNDAARQVAAVKAGAR